MELQDNFWAPRHQGFKEFPWLAILYVCCSYWCWQRDLFHIWNISLNPFLAINHKSEHPCCQWVLAVIVNMKGIWGTSSLWKVALYELLGSFWNRLFQQHFLVLLFKVFYHQMVLYFCHFHFINMVYYTDFSPWTDYSFLSQLLLCHGL